MTTSRRKSPPAPRHLKPTTRKWWSTVVEEYLLEGHHLRLLQLAAESWDRAQECREAIRRHGLVFKDRFGCPHPRPEVKGERDAGIAFARYVRELALDIEAPAEVRPPRLVGGRHAS